MGSGAFHDKGDKSAKTDPVVAQMNSEMDAALQVGDRGRIAFAAARITAHGLSTGDPAIALSGALSLRTLGHPEAAPALLKVAGLAEKTGDGLTLLQAARNLITYHQDTVTQVENIPTRPRDEGIRRLQAIIKDVLVKHPDVALHAAELLYDLKDNRVPLAELQNVIANIAKAALATNPSQAATTLRAAHLLLETGAPPPDQIVDQLLQPAAKEAVSTGNVELSLRIAEALADIPGSRQALINDIVQGLLPALQKNEDASDILQAAGLLQANAIAERSGKMIDGLFGMYSKLEQADATTYSEQLDGAELLARIASPEAAAQAGILADRIGDRVIASKDPEAIQDAADRLIAVAKLLHAAKQDPGRVQAAAAQLAIASLQLVSKLEDADELQKAVEAIVLAETAGQDMRDARQKMARVVVEKAQATFKDPGESSTALELLQAGVRVGLDPTNATAAQALEISNALLNQPDTALANADLILQGVEMGMLEARRLKDMAPGNEAIRQADALYQKAMAAKDRDTAYLAADLIRRNTSDDVAKQWQARVLELRTGKLPADHPPAFTGVPGDFAKADVTKFNYQDKISDARQNEQITIIHYHSKALLSDGQKKGVTDFANIAGRATQLAYRELLGERLGLWNATGAHLTRLLHLRRDWQKVDKDEGLFFDLQKLKAINEGKKQDNSPYLEQLLIHQATATDDTSGEFDQDTFIALRKTHYQDHPEARDYPEGRALKFLHTLAGYLIEERTYQLLPPRAAWDRDWDDQDTSILGSGTRPDITQQVESGPAIYALYDLTAYNSQGHILKKSPSWVDSSKVGDSVEILYPSIDKDTLINVLLNRQTFSDAEIQRRQQARESELAQKAAQQRQTMEFIRAVRNSASAKRFLELFDSPADGKHLLQQYGLLGKGYGSPVKGGADKERVDRGLKKLVEKVKLNPLPGIVMPSFL